MCLTSAVFIGNFTTENRCSEAAEEIVINIRFFTQNLSRFFSGGAETQRTDYQLDVLFPWSVRGARPSCREKSENQRSIHNSTTLRPTAPIGQ
jgi:hypothetical protein